MQKFTTRIIRKKININNSSFIQATNQEISNYLQQQTLIRFHADSACRMNNKYYGINNKDTGRRHYFAGEGDIVLSKNIDTGEYFTILENKYYIVKEADPIDTVTDSLAKMSENLKKQEVENYREK